MKAKIKLIIFLSIIIILLFVGIIFIIKENKKDRTINLYEKLKDNEEYTFSIEGENINYKYQLHILKKGTNYCIDMYNDNEHTSTLLKDGYVYYIIYSEEEYYSMYDKEININIVENALSVVKNKEYKNEKENINEKQYYYEEYEGITDFIMNLSYSEEDKIKTRFYFEGNNIKYIKNICEENEELLKVECDYKVNEEQMEVPSSFAEK